MSGIKEMTGDFQKDFESWFWNTHKDVYGVSTHSVLQKLTNSMIQCLQQQFLEHKKIFIQIPIFSYAETHATYIAEIKWCEPLICHQLTSHIQGDKLSWESFDLEKGLYVFDDKFMALQKALEKAECIYEQKFN